MIEKIIFFVEEESMEAFLRGMLPKIINCEFEIHSFMGKTRLINKLPERIRAYASWLPSSCKIFILIDRDNQNCVHLKNQLESIIMQSGMNTRSQRKYDDSFHVVNRIVIEELEAWYFGDWQAVCKAYPKVSRFLPAKYKQPDMINGGTWEAFERILQKSGYFMGGLPKIEVARNIVTYMNPFHNTSRSFCCFRDALLELQ